MGGHAGRMNGRLMDEPTLVLPEKAQLERKTCAANDEYTLFEMKFTPCFLNEEYTHIWVKFAPKSAKQNLAWPASCERYLKYIFISS